MAMTSAARPVVLRCAFCGTRNRIDLARLGDGPRCAECKRPILLDRPRAVSAEELGETVEDAGAPVIVDFYADWCGPCRAMAPTLDTFAAERAGQVLVLKLDTDRHPEMAARFGIRGIPTLIAFAGGREAGRHVGMADLATLDRLAGLA